jgi:hypothetical protein
VARKALAAVAISAAGAATTTAWASKAQATAVKKSSDRRTVISRRA